jgi:hypothetical protein
MSDHRDRLQCPLCAGHGEARRSRLIEFFSDPELKSKIDAYLASITPTGDDTAELVGVPGGQPRNFQKDVHSWNPQLPMWRRSPKE